MLCWVCNHSIDLMNSEDAPVANFFVRCGRRPHVVLEPCGILVFDDRGKPARSNGMPAIVRPT